MQNKNPMSDRAPDARTSLKQPLPLLVNVSQSFGAVFLFRILSTGLSFLAIALVGRSLGAAGLGDLTMARVLMLTLAGLLGPALDTAAVRFATRHPKQAADYLRAILAVKTSVTVLFLVLGVVLSAWLGRVLFPGASARFDVYVLVFAAFAGSGGFLLFEYVRVCHQAHQRFVTFGALDFYHALVRLIVIGALLAVGMRSPLPLFLTYAALPYVLFVVTLRSVPGYAGMTRASLSAHLREMVPFVRWVIFACALTSAANGADMLLLGWLGVGEIPRGDYSAARALSQIGDLVVLSLFNVLLPKAGGYRTPSEGYRFLKLYGIPLTTAGVVFASLLIPLMPLIRLSLTLPFGSEFARADTCLAVMLFGMVLAIVGVPASALVYSLGRSRTIALLEAIKLILTILLAWYIVPQYGILGMAWTTALVKGTISLLTLTAAVFALRADAGQQQSVSEKNG